MKKIKIALVILIMLVVPTWVNAAVLTASTCSTDAYRVQRLREGNSNNSHVVPIPTNSKYSNGLYKMYTYDTYNSDGTLAGQTYCLSPGRQGTGGFPRTGGAATYYCETKIDPYSNRPYDIAVAKAYQLFIDRYGATSDTSRAVGEIVFRYLGYRYNAGDRGNNSGNEGADHLAHFTLENGGFSSLWKESEYINSAREIYNEAVRVGDMAASGKTFDELVDEGYIWSPKWEYSIVSRTQNGNQIELTIALDNTGNAPQQIQWDAFSATCENGYQCTYQMLNASSGPGSAGKQMKITIDTSNGKGDYGLKIHTAYYDPKSANANMMILASANDIGKGKNFSSYYNQRFLVISNEIGLRTGNDRIWDRQEIIIKDDSCACHFDNHGVWDGYVLTYYQKSIVSVTSPYTGTTSASSLLDNQKFVKKDDLKDEDKNNFKCQPCPPSSPDICNKNFSDQNQWVCGDHNGDGNGELCKDVLENGNNIEQQWTQDCEIPLDGYQTCVCDNATGYYDFKKYDGYGNEILHQTWKYGSTAPSGIDAKKCPTTCGGGGGNDSCKKPSESSDGKYHDKNGNECSKDQYYKDCECGQLEDKCKDPNADGCDDYYKYCVKCTPSVTIPSDCTDFGDEIYSGSTKEGGISDIAKKGNACNNNQANMVKSCVIGKSDAAGQSFEDTTVSVKNNKYCSIWCEESYTFGLPTARRTQSGGYFTLENLNVSGTRNCYASAREDTTKPIDKDQFLKDFAEKQKEITDNYDKYIKNKMLYDAFAAVKGVTSAAGGETENGVVKRQNKTDNYGNPIPKKDAAGNTVYNNGLPVYETEVVGKKCQGDCKNPAGATADECTEWNYYTGLGCEAVTVYTVPEVKNIPQILAELSADKKDVIYHDQVVTEQSHTYGKANPTDLCNTQNTCGYDGTADFEAAMADFQSKYQEAESQMPILLKELDEIVKQYNSCSGDLGDADGWVNTFNFDPEITFSYNESYNSQLNNSGKFEEISKGTSVNSSTYCNDDTNQAYECASPIQGDDAVPGASQEEKQYRKCDTNGCPTDQYTVSKALRVQRTRSESATFAAKNTFSTYTQYGTIQKDVNTGNFALYTPLPEDAFPISLITKTGVFPFNIKFNNIGQSNSDSSKLGRLIGDKYSGGDILTAFNNLAPNDKCNINGQKDPSYQAATTQSGYVCHYINNCDDCKIECEDGECSFDDEDKCDGECTYTCENCLFDGKSVNYTFRTVSLNNLFPNVRPEGYGYNWNIESNLKAEITSKAIEKDGESIYQKAQYSYTLTPQSIARIREYNQKASSYVNTYIPSEYETIAVGSNSSNEAVYCEKYDGTGVDGQLYNVRCRSKFLDILDALEGSGRAMASNITRITRENDAWELFDRYCAGSYGAGNCKNVGPSWRLRSVD